MFHGIEVAQRKNANSRGLARLGRLILEPTSPLAITVERGAMTILSGNSSKGWMTAFSDQ